MPACYLSFFLVVANFYRCFRCQIDKSFDTTLPPHRDELVYRVHLQCQCQDFWRCCQICKLAIRPSPFCPCTDTNILVGVSFHWIAQAPSALSRTLQVLSHQTLASLKRGLLNTFNTAKLLASDLFHHHRRVLTAHSESLHLARYLARKLVIATPRLARLADVLSKRTRRIADTVRIHVLTDS